MLSGKQARRTRVAAGLAIVLLGVVVVLSIASVNDDLRRLSVQIPLLLLAVAAAWYALTRTGARRVVGAAVVSVALIGVIGYGFVQDPSTFAVALGRLALLALAVLLGRWAVRRTWAAAEPPDPPTAPVHGAAAHGPGAHGRSDGRPALIINLRSGGGKAEQVHLVEECRSRGIVPIVLQPGDDLQVLARGAVDSGAPVIGMAGGDGSQALVATTSGSRDRTVATTIGPTSSRSPTTPTAKGATSGGDRSAAAFLAAVAGGRPDHFSGFSSWTATSFEVDSGGLIDAGLDGESLTLPRPLRFTIRPQALLLLLPPEVADAPGASSAPRATLKDVGRVAAGRPVVR